MRRLLLILGVAIIVRALVFIELRDSPILYLDRWSETDNSFYDGWARKIVGGDLLSVHDVRPFHSWHEHIARAAHEASGSTEPFGESVGRRTWDEWLGPRTFYQDPLYPYSLAALYASFGRHHRLVFAVQSLLSLLAITLLFSIARRMFDDTVALVAGLLAALYGPLLLYENVLLRTILINTTGLVTLWLAIRAFRTPSARRFALVGLAGAISGLATSSGWAFVAALFALTPIALRHDPRRCLRAVGALALGVLLGLSPVVARNLAVHVSPFSLASSGAITFVNHNAADYQPRSGTAMSRYAADIMSRSQGRLLPAIALTVNTHASIGRWLRLLGRKFLAVFTAYEIPNNESYDYFLLQVPIARAIGVSFGLIAPLGIVGLVLGRRRSWEYGLTFAYLAAGMVSLVLLYTLGRLRLPTAFAAIPFAAFGLVESLRAVAEARAGRALVLFASFVALALVIDWPFALHTPRVADFGVANEIALHLAEQRFAGEPRRAEAILEHQLQTEPDDLRVLQPTGPTTTLSILSADLAASFAPLHRSLAGLLEKRGAMGAAEGERYRATLLETIARERAMHTRSSQ